jgi:hypothetical protein
LRQPLNGDQRRIGGAKRERGVPSSTSRGSSPNFSLAARAAALFAAKSSRCEPEYRYCRAIEKAP